MTHLQRAVASLRVIGDDVVPAEITRLLGTSPTAAYAKGDKWDLPSRGGVRTSGMWRLDAEVTEPENLGEQIFELLRRTTTDLDVWQALSGRFRVDLFCGWFMSGSNEGVEISPVTMIALGARGIVLSVDIYSPDVEGEHG
ncbi:DUF4279 domain-containing protein [Variovorax sp. Root411]|uniref:DUF4279 domain-containing protein n=1 Tax=Variovorax sp. Root411 TaxID=1736530 RepID=UPI0009EBCEB3|nr:DUF4279 domain-containing protein [Variovorax sp. Root411]